MDNLQKLKLSNIVEYAEHIVSNLDKSRSIYNEVTDLNVSSETHLVKVVNYISDLIRNLSFELDEMTNNYNVLKEIVIRINEDLNTEVEDRKQYLLETLKETVKTLKSEVE